MAAPWGLLVSCSQTASSPPFLHNDVISLYCFCAEPPELGGSLIYSNHGNNDIHNDKLRYTTTRIVSLASADVALLYLSGGFKQLC